MPNQTEFGVLLEKVKLQIRGYFQAFRERGSAQEQSKPNRQRTATAGAEIQASYSGPPLEIGNELLITAEVVKTYRGLTNALGRVVIIDQISTNGSETIKASAFGIQVYVEIKVAWQMREAYLRREQVWSPR